MKLVFDDSTLDDAKSRFCYGCGSEKLVSSYSRLDFRTREEKRGWVCEPCLRRMQHDWWQEHIEAIAQKRRENAIVMFGHEGFVNDYLTVWHEKEVNGKLGELNVQLREKCFRTRFFFTLDQNLPERPAYVVVDNGGRPEEADAVREAEKTVQELCRRLSIPVLHSRIADAVSRGLRPSLESGFEW